MVVYDEIQQVRAKPSRIQYHWKAEKVLRHSSCQHFCGQNNTFPLDTLRVTVSQKAALQLALLSPRPDRATHEVMKLLGEDKLVLSALAVAMLLGNSL